MQSIERLYVAEIKWTESKVVAAMDFQDKVEENDWRTLICILSFPYSASG